MISVLFIWDRLQNYAAKYQSGADTVAYFNTALSEVQLEVYNTLSPIYDKNEKVRDLMNFWVRQQIATSISTGVSSIGTSPEIVDRILSIGYTDISQNIVFAIPETSESELIASARIPQRAPNTAKKNVYFRFNTPGTLNFYPATTTPYYAYYLIYPTEAKIAFTYTSTDDEDVMTYDPDNSTDLEWPASATNIILYSMLEKYGVSVREQLLQEYSRYGIVRSETTPQEVKG